jgi:hypothetical protein
MAAIFYLPITPMSNSVHNSLTDLLDPEDMGAAFWISLLCSLEDEILRYSIGISGNGDHLGFTTYAAVG